MFPTVTPPGPYPSLPGRVSKDCTVRVRWNVGRFLYDL